MGDMKSIKIDEKIYDELKKLKGDKSFNETLQSLLEAVKKAREEAVKQYKKQFSDIKEIADDLANYLISKGYFDIRIKDIGIKSVSYLDDGIVISGYVYIGIPNEEIRSTIFQKIMDKISGGE